VPSGFYDQAGAGTQAGIDQMMMHSGGRQQRRYGDVLSIDRASERIRILQPSRTAVSVAAHSASSAAAMPAAPWSAA